MKKQIITLISLCLLFSLPLVTSVYGAGAQPNLKLVHIDRLDSGLTYGTYTVENLRGFNNVGAPCALYSNQDMRAIYCMLGRALILLCDGHGPYGGVVADKVTSLLPLEVFKTKDAAVGFQNGFQKLQQMFEKATYAQQSGTTCVGVQIHGNKLTIANAGDSRLVVIRPNGKTASVVFSTIDHKPSNQQELSRIKAAKGVTNGGYIINKNGNGLAVTRTLGDVEFHQDDLVIAAPELFEFTLQDGDSVFLASDGYWDVFSNSETALNASLQLKETAAHCGSKQLQAMGIDLNNHDEVQQAWNGHFCSHFAEFSAKAARSKGSYDDITVTVVRYSEL